MAKFLTVICCLMLCIYYIYCATEKIAYLSVEHPKVTYYNPKFLAYANLTSIRYGRSNPIYYVGFHIEPIVNFDSSIYIDVYFYELLTGVYKRSFIELHYTWCHLVEKDLLFGASMRAAGLNTPCPHVPGRYNLANMTVNPAAIPGGFPFTRGRIVANFTHPKTKTRVGEGYIDMRLSYIDKKDSKLLYWGK